MRVDFLYILVTHKPTYMRTLKLLLYCGAAKINNGHNVDTLMMMMMNYNILLNYMGIIKYWESGI